MRFGVKTVPQHTTWGEMLDVWRAADEIELFESVWNWDHFYPLTGDFHGRVRGWTSRPMAEATPNRIRIGCQVTGMIYRHPAVLGGIWPRRSTSSRGAGWSWASAPAGTRWRPTRTASRCIASVSASIVSMKASRRSSPCSLRKRPRWTAGT